jgi:hypothetical protein
MSIKREGEPQEWHPCNKEQGFCKALLKRMKFPGEAGYGFFALMVIKRIPMAGKKIKTGESLKGAMYRESRKDKGLMINFCPFCGRRIDWFNQEGLITQQAIEEKGYEIQTK